MSQRVLVVGASSGIGEGLARLLIARGDRVAITGRRVGLLRAIQGELGSGLTVMRMDVRKTAASVKAFGSLVKKLGGMDLIILNAGWGDSGDDGWGIDKNTIDTNVSGFAALANAAWQHFKKQGHGHLVGISSIAALRGGRHAVAYNASKAFMSSYLEGLRHKAVYTGLDITVTDIQPGFVDTAMAGSDRVFWLAPVEKAARQIIRAIDKKKEHAYITRRWRLIAWILKGLPAFIYRKL